MISRYVLQNKEKAVDDTTMHETSLIEFTLNAVKERASLMGIKKVGEIGIVVGRLAAVPQLMHSAFDIMKYGQKMFENTKLVIEFREISFRCLSCGKDFTTESYIDAHCPVCSSDQLERTGGDELYIDYFIPAMPDMSENQTLQSQ